MRNLTEGLEIGINISTNFSLDPSVITKFESLNRVTKVSIEGELTACTNEVEYAHVAAPWVPVKCYYRLYYLESILLYLLSGSNVGFRNGGHTRVRAHMRDVVDRKVLLLNNVSSELGTKLKLVDAMGFRAEIGATIRSGYYSHADCPKSLRKKLSEYIEHDWMKLNNIPNYRSKAAKLRKIIELLPKELNLLDYFYWMRIKANYRDVDFLDFDREVTATDAYEYLSEYVQLTENYGSALERAIVVLKQKRGMV